MEIRQFMKRNNISDERSVENVPSKILRIEVQSVQTNAVILKLCVVTPWCVVLIFQWRRAKVNSVQFY